MAKIGEILIAEGHLTREGLEEALDWQVLYGGRIGTNLLELRLVEEQHLAQALARQLGVEVAFGNLEVDPALVPALPPHVADRQEMVPWKLEKRRLKLLCCDIKVSELDQLSYRIGRTCVPVVAPEYRIFQLLRAHYGASRQMRALDFGVVPEEGREERRRRKGKGGAKTADPGPELIDERAFNDIYNQVQGKAAADLPQAEWPSAPELPKGVAPRVPARRTKPPPPHDPAASWHTQGPRPAAPPALQSFRAAGPEEEPLPSLPEDAILEELPADAIIGEPMQQLVAARFTDDAEEPLPVVSWEDVTEPPPPPPRDESPLDFAQALKELERVSDRDSIAHIVLRASRSKAARALLLQVQGGVALGWDGLGEGLDGGAARQVAMPLSADSAFSLVVRTRSHYMGPLHKTPGNIRFLAMLGKKVPLSSLIFPILHRGRVSHMLYLDNGHRQQAPTEVGEMLILSQRIGQTVDALVARKRKAALG
jgi:type II secretion system (T2SS) protein E